MICTTRAVLDRQELAKGSLLASYFAAVSSTIVRLTLAPGTKDVCDDSRRGYRSPGADRGGAGAVHDASTEAERGECEAIVLCQQRRIPLLSNDRRAIRYCQAAGIDALDLATLLRLFWIQHLATRVEVEQIICRMEQVERLSLSTEQRAAIFGPPRR